MPWVVVNVNGRRGKEHQMVDSAAQALHHALDAWPESAPFHIEFVNDTTVMDALLSAEFDKGFAAGWCAARRATKQALSKVDGDAL